MTIVHKTFLLGCLVEIGVNTIIWYTRIRMNAIAEYILIILNSAEYIVKIIRKLFQQIISHIKWCSFLFNPWLNLTISHE